jgi:serine O-acetyltransferase
MGFKQYIINRIFFCDHGSEYIWKARQNAINKPKVVRLIYKYIYHRIQVKNNAFFPLATKVLSMPIFPHGLYGVFISQGAEIGENCTIFHQVTIGSNTLDDSKGKGSPIICNNVYIGAGAKIIGSVKVGNNCRIGANCVVTKDVPDNSTVVSAPIRIITKNKIMDNNFKIFRK